MYSMVESELVNDYLTTYSNVKSKHAIKYQIKKYLLWRQISLSELIESGSNEQKFFDEFMLSREIEIIPTSRNPIISCVKKFLVHSGADFKQYMSVKKSNRYLDDKYMQDFITLSGSAISTRKNVNRSLAYYCDFRNKTPTELIAELDQVTKGDIRVHLKRFYDSLELKDKRKVVGTITRFYRWIADFYIELPRNMKSRKIALLTNAKTIEKETVKTLLTVADVRDSMILLTCYESGINPCDLVSLTYGLLKDYLNLDNPEAITEVAVFLHKRQKTDCEFYACLGVNSLQYISRWLKFIKNILGEMGKQLTDTQAIFSRKNYPYEALKTEAVSTRLRKICYKAGLDHQLTTADFRNNFNTRLKPHLKPFDKELFMGHSGGLERHYDTSSLEYYQSEYQKVWDIVFDLSYDNEKVLSLDEENKEIKTALKNLSNILENFYSALIEPEGGTNITREDFEKALNKLRKIT